MTDRLPTLKATEVVRALEKAGFAVVRTTGSHHRLVHQSDPSRATTVPVHKGRDIPRPFLRAILKQARLSVDEFVALL
jgi:predicted RNA binding protein YcfA (HicA-like mRNA interferase family)